MLGHIGIGLAVLAIAPCLNAQSRCSSLEAEGRSAMQSRDYQGAARHFSEALGACPTNGSLRIDLAQAYLMSQQIKDALAETEIILRAQPDEVTALKIRGNAAYLLGDLAIAKDTFIRLLDRHPSDQEGAYMLGRIYYQEGNIDLAIGQFERVRKMNPTHYKALDNLGLCYQAQGDDENAKRYYLAAIKLVEKDHPDYEWPYTNLADLLLKSGDAQRAYDAASKAANRNPQSARSFYIGAKALDQLGKTELASNWLQRSVALNPASSESWYLLARVYRKLQKNDRSEERRVGEECRSRW